MGSILSSKWKGAPRLILLDGIVSILDTHVRKCPDSFPLFSLLATPYVLPILVLLNWCSPWPPSTDLIQTLHISLNNHLPLGLQGLQFYGPLIHFLLSFRYKSDHLTLPLNPFTPQDKVWTPSRFHPTGIYQTPTAGWCVLGPGARERNKILVS